MTRSMVLAILAFTVLVLTNIAIFGFLSFGTLSEKMVTEKLMEGMNEAQSLLNQQIAEAGRSLDENPLRLSRDLAPRLRRYSFFKAVVVLDRQGRVVHREEIGSTLVRWPGTANPRQPSPNGLRMMPVQAPASPTRQEEPRLAIEYNPETIRQEVEALRTDLNQKLRIAIFISLLLLIAGFGYVFWAYRRNQQLQLQAQQADRMAYVGTLSSGLAHEIRNPLNSMNMNVQLIQEELEERNLDKSGEICELLESTRGEVRRLEDLVSSFLAYARPSQLKTQKCQINDLVYNTVRFLKPEIDSKGVALKTHLDPRLPEINVDKHQLRQAVINIVQNAAQVLQPRQILEIRTRIAGGDKVLIIIHDEGPGISPEELKNIFKVFYSTKKGGSGLGLPTAQRIAELHQGGIKVESEVGVGSTFTIILPMESVAA